MQQWFAVKTKPRRELQAYSVLTQRGVEAFLPRLRRRQRRANLAPAYEPLFPGYLFSRLELGSQEWLRARSAPSVAYFLGVHGVPAPLPDELVEHIRARTEAQAAATWKPPFQKGDRVDISGGPFAGLDAVFDSMLSPSGRVRVFLETVNRLVPVDLHIDALSLRRLRPAS